MDLSTIDPIRFWAKVAKRGPDDCWLWTGATSTCNQQYTPMTYGAYKQTRAHRCAWVLANGRAPLPGYVIRHNCDVPLCCNPQHLCEGTRGDNQRDMQLRLRSGVLGTKNPKAVLSEADVMDIRGSTESDRALASKYGIGISAIYYARTGHKWKHLPGANPGFYRKAPTLGSEQRAEIVRRRAAGEQLKAIAASLGVSIPQVWQVAKAAGMCRTYSARM